MGQLRPYCSVPCATNLIDLQSRFHCALIHDSLIPYTRFKDIGILVSLPR